MSCESTPKPAPEARERPAAGDTEPDATPPSSDAHAAYVGAWRATLDSPGGALPFGLELRRTGDGLSAHAINGSERVPFSAVLATPHDVTLRIDVYDSLINGVLTQDGNELIGTWTKTTPKGPSTMSFRAQRGELPRFDTPIEKPPYEVPASVDGQWAITFTEDDGSTFVGHGLFATARADLEGTILTDTGDYRYLHGRYESGTLELSCFDGGHAFLFRARADEAGALHGDFWSRAAYHAGMHATRMKPGDASPLANPFAIVDLSAEAKKDGRFRFSFPDLEDNAVSDTDPRFAGKVVLVDVFGTWCPNCNDYAPLLAKWHERYGPRGLEIVGLAFEMTGDAARDRRLVRRYADRHGIGFPLLLAGTSGKTDAAAALPSLTKVAAYPTTIFVGRDGRVRKIHSGFAGPATGEHHERLVHELEAEIETLLDEGQ